MKRCGACDTPFHKGRRRLVLLPTGELVSRLVCQTCAAGGVCIVATRMPVAQCEQCTAPARYCDAHRRRPAELEIIEKRLRTFIDAANAGSARISGGISAAVLAGKAEGLESALALVLAVAGGRPL